MATTARRLILASLALTAAALFAGCADAAAVPAAPVATASATVAAPTLDPAAAVLSATTRDDAYITTLDNHGIRYSSRAAAIALGRFAAKLHREDGWSVTELIAPLTEGPNPSWTPEEASTIVGAALGAYGS